MFSCLQVLVLIDWPQPPRTQCPGWGWVDCDLPYTPRSPGGKHVVHRWESQAGDTVKFVLVLGSGCSAPDGDGGEDELNDGSVKLHPVLARVQFPS